MASDAGRTNRRNPLIMAPSLVASRSRSPFLCLKEIRGVKTRNLQKTVKSRFYVGVAQAVECAGASHRSPRPGPSYRQLRQERHRRFVEPSTRRVVAGPDPTDRRRLSARESLTVIAARRGTSVRVPASPPWGSCVRKYRVCIHSPGKCISQKLQILPRHHHKPSRAAGASVRPVWPSAPALTRA
jgi:hypothetical protein